MIYQVFTAYVTCILFHSIMLRKEKAYFLNKVLTCLRIRTKTTFQYLSLFMICVQTSTFQVYK